MSEQYRNRYKAAGWDHFPLIGKHPRVKWTTSFKGEWSQADNVGVALGKRSNNLVDLDLDWPEAPGLARWLIGVDKTMMFGRTGKTSSHFLFYSEIEKTKKFSLPKSFLGRGVPEEHALTVCELRTTGAYTMFPPSTHPNGEEVGFENNCEVARVDADWLRRSSGIVAFASVCVRFWPGDGAQHDAALAFAGVMKWAGVPMEVTLGIVRGVSTADSEASDRVRAVEDTYSSDATTSKWRKLFEAFAFPSDARPVFSDWLGLSDHSAVEQYNEKYAVIRDGSRVRIGTLRVDPHFGRETWDLMSETDFMLLEKKRKEAAIWVQAETRRDYPNGFIFDPTGLEREGYLNLWKGWAVEPASGDWSLIKRHIHEVLACSNEDHGSYIVRWIAWMLQNPHRPAEVAIVLRGEKGVGKGVIGRALGKLAGQHGIQISSSSLMTGRFNAHMRDCIYLFADEAFWAGDKDGEGQLKRMITEDTLVIEGKGRDALVTPNMLHIMIASNEDWIVPASSDERRFAAFDVSSVYQGDRDYFDALQAQIDGGGLAAMLDELLALDLGRWHPRLDIPKTEALRMQVQHSEDPVRSQFREWLHVCQLPGLMPDRNQPNELFFPELRRALDARPFGRGVTTAKVGRFLSTIPGAVKDNNGWVFDRMCPKENKPILKRCLRVLLPPLGEVRAWFDACEPWHDLEDWEFALYPGNDADF